MTQPSEFPADQPDEVESAEPVAAIKEPRLWVDRGWTAKVVKNEDDDGWAVAMYVDGQSEPALVAPWTMGRDKKNPKPLDTAAFNTWVKTASEVIRRHEQHLHALLHKEVSVVVGTDRWAVMLDIVPDDDDPHAYLRAVDVYGEEAAKVRVKPNHKLTATNAEAWIVGGFGKPVG